MPSKADSKLIVNYILIRTDISGWYVINIIIVFLLTASTYAMKYYFLGYYPAYWYVEPLLMGIWSVISYLILFGLIVMFTEEKKIFPKKRRNIHQDGGYSMTEEEVELLNELEMTT